MHLDIARSLRYQERVALVCLCLFLAMLQACSSSSSSSSDQSPASSTSSQVKGTATIRGPLANAEIVLKDRSGRMARTKAAADGTFIIDTTALSPPYLIRATPVGSNYALYSASNTVDPDGVINITQLTNLIVRTWYRFQQHDVDASFEAGDGAWVAPIALKLIGNAYVRILEPWLHNAGVAADFDPFSTEFLADGTGIDSVLTQLIVRTDEYLLVIQGDVTQRIEIAVDASSGTLTAVSSIASQNGTSRRVLQTVVPTTSDQQRAAEAIDARIAALGNIISERGEALTAEDLLPLISPTLVHDGFDRAQYAALLATAQRGRAPACGLHLINALEGAPAIADVVVRCRTSHEQGTRVVDEPMRLSQAADWLIEGNQRLARLDVQAEWVSWQGAVTEQTATLKVRASALAPAGQIVAATVRGPGIATEGIALAPERGIDLMLAPAPDNALTIQRDQFAALIEEAAPPTDLLQYEFVLTSATGEEARHVIHGAYTTESVSLVNLNGSALRDARLGEPLRVEWTAPTTFAAKSIQLQAISFAGDDESAPACIVNGPAVPTPLTEGTITIPAECEGSRPERVLLNVIVTGTAGERSVTAYVFKRAPEEFVPTVMDLPIVRIITENRAPIESKDEYIRATLTIDPNGAAFEAFSAPLRIRGRGNSTWAMPKKPYRLKLDEAAPLLGMPANRDWVMLANYADKSLLRTHVAFELGNRVGLAWSPRFRFVEVFINDQYLGTYQLGEQIKVDTDRVNIPEPDEDDIEGSALTGGYLLEIDERLDGDVYFRTRLGVPFVLDTPEEPTPEQRAYIESYIQQTEDAIYSPDFADPETGYAAYIDVDSFIHWYLVNEIMKNNDAIFFSSCWMYKQRDDKLFMGPLWDFDIAAGNINYNNNDDPTGWWIRKAPWINRLFDDPAFEARVRNRWSELKATQIDTILEFIDEWASTLSLAASNNFERWPILDQWVWPNAVVTGSYEGEVEYLRSWLETRIAWMDAQFNP